MACAEMDNHNGDGVQEIDFLVSMLVTVNGLDRDKDIEPWRAVTGQLAL